MSKEPTDWRAVWEGSAEQAMEAAVAAEYEHDDLMVPVNDPSYMDDTLLHIDDPDDSDDDEAERAWDDMADEDNEADWYDEEADVDDFDEDDRPYDEADDLSWTDAFKVC